MKICVVSLHHIVDLCVCAVGRTVNPALVLDHIERLAWCQFIMCGEEIFLCKTSSAFSP